MGSTVTAEVHLRRLSFFCEQNGLTPKELVDFGRKNRKKLEDTIEDHVTKMKSKKIYRVHCRNFKGCQIVACPQRGRIEEKRKDF
jgi:hypothetical protein